MHPVFILYGKGKFFHKHLRSATAKQFRVAKKSYVVIFPVWRRIMHLKKKLL